MSMVLEKAAVSPLFTFEHLAHGATGLLEVEKNVDRRRVGGRSDIRFVIKNLGLEVGLIAGRWLESTNGFVVFEEFTSGNSQDRDLSGRFPLPRIVGSTIAQIVLREIVDVWYSAYFLSYDGRDMYSRYLTNHPGLNVRRSEDRYKVTKD